MNSMINLQHRKKLLKKLLSEVKNNEKEITDALYRDFKKPVFETYLTEFQYVISDLKLTLRKINSWSKPKRIRPSLLNFPSREYIYNDPYGRVLIISPWNYPFQLAICPLIAAIAAGNSVVLKPSEFSFHTSQIITKIIGEVFDVKEAVVIHGGPQMAQSLLEKRWDYIFFTGSVRVGQMVAQAAAKFMTPVTLELGGKNPCIIHPSANMAVTAKRIVWGKFLNAGQTCIAPDYILVEATVKLKLIEALKREIVFAYGNNPQNSSDFARIINDEHWIRLHNLIDDTKVIFGGQTHENDRYIAPTLIDEPSLDDEIMQNEIFGPILPIISFHDISDVKKYIHHFEKPLALYVFAEDSVFAEQIFKTFSFGGGALNDTILQVVNPRLPFGGVGQSGIGAYHGNYGFQTFSHQKSIIKRPTWLDPSLRYAPYKNKIQWVKKILKWM
jgi:aldehyde dehydrogenase (NAD+)